MALVVTVLENQILAALEKQAAKVNENDSPEQSRKELAKDIAQAFDAYIKTADVNTVVNGTSPSGAVTGAGVGNLS